MKVAPPRQLTLFGRIDETVVANLISEIVGPKAQNVKSVELLINSKGGAVSSALNLYDAIMDSGIDFTGVVVAECLSSAVTVLQACQTRRAFPNAIFQVHETSRVLSLKIVKSNSLKSYIAELEACYNGVGEMEDRNTKLLTSRLRRSRKLFNRHFKTDTHFGAEEACTMGLIDCVVEKLGPAVPKSLQSPIRRS